MNVADSPNVMAPRLRTETLRPLVPRLRSSMVRARIGTPERDVKSRDLALFAALATANDEADEDPSAPNETIGDAWPIPMLHVLADGEEVSVESLSVAIGLESPPASEVASTLAADPPSTSAPPGPRDLRAARTHRGPNSTRPFVGAPATTRWRRGPVDRRHEERCPAAIDRESDPRKAIRSCRGRAKIRRPEPEENVVIALRARRPWCQRSDEERVDCWPDTGVEGSGLAATSTVPSAEHREFPRCRVVRRVGGRRACHVRRDGRRSRVVGREHVQLAASVPFRIVRHVRRVESTARVAIRTRSAVVGAVCAAVGLA